MKPIDYDTGLAKPRFKQELGKWLAAVLFAAAVVYIVSIMAGCAFAPPVVRNQGGSISESGKADSGFMARQGDGFLVQPSVRASYTALLIKYGGRLTPPNPNPDVGWKLDSGTPGLYWCSNKVANDLALMLFYQRQDLKL